MHILIVPSALYIPAHQSCSGIFQHHQAAALSQQGHKVGVASFGFKTMRHWWRSADYPDSERCGSDIFIIRRFVRLPFPHRLITPELIESHYVKGFAKIIEQYISVAGRPDVIHAHDYVYAGIACSKVGQVLGIPVIVTVHSSELARKRLPGSLLKRIAESSGQVCATIAVSRSLQEALFSMGILSPINEVVPNVLDPEQSGKELAKSTGSCVEAGSIEYRYINVASLDDNKNQALLIRAFAALMDVYPGSRLTIVGAGKNRARLEVLANRLGLKPFVQFISYLDRVAIFQELQSAQCFVMSSRFETFGVALIEALSVGLPVVSTRCGGANDIVESHNGVLVESDSVEELASGLVYVQSNAHLYDREVIRRRALDRFGAGSVVRHLESVYRECAGRLV